MFKVQFGRNSRCLSTKSSLPFLVLFNLLFFFVLGEQSGGLTNYYSTPWDSMEQDHGAWNLSRDLTFNFIMKTTTLFFQKLNLSTRIDVLFLNKLVSLTPRKFIIPGTLLSKIIVIILQSVFKELNGVVREILLKIT